MWDPKIDSSSAGASATTAQNSNNSAKLLPAEDSGEIDSGFLSSELILSSYEDEEDNTTKSAQLPEIPFADSSAKSSFDVAPVAAHKKQNDDDYDLKEQQSTSDYLDSGLVEDAEFLSYESKYEDEQREEEPEQDMLLERGLDNGLAEWLCTLDLKNNTAAQGGANNLGRRVDCTTSSMEQMNISAAAPKRSKKQQQQQQVHQAQEEKKPLIEMPEEEQPWEMCYKQDAEGNT